MNLYDIINKLKEISGMHPKRVFENNRKSMSVELCRDLSEEISITSVDNMPCEVALHARYNCFKGLIYLNEYDIDNVEEYKEGLQSNYIISDAEPAPFIKTKSEQAHAFIVPFNQECLSYSIYTPGERSDTRLYKVNSKLLMCNRCLKYGHAKKMVQERRGCMQEMCWEWSQYRAMW